ncbi:MAG: hypothetical protein Ta2G_18940 [Termitinemataceae bacterium]|nr:MAG: hypothetical protein Ta2G_18940 [Termitinemataceae bacterium]
MKKLQFLGFAVILSAFVFSACDNGTYTSDTEGLDATLTLESGKKWTYTSGTTVVSGTYEKIDDVYYFIVETSDNDSDIGTVAFTAVKDGKTFIFRGGGGTFTKSADGDVTIKIIGELED